MLTSTIKTVIRPFSIDDAQKVVDLINACSQRLHGWDTADLDEMINDWSSPGINVHETIRVVENKQGDLIGYVDVWDNTNPHVVKYVWAILHPDAWDDNLYRQMLVWAEECSRQRIYLAPENSRVIMSQGIANKDIHRKIALEIYGFELVRHFYRMQINLGRKPDQPVIPDGLIIETIDYPSELKAAILAMDEGFEDHWGYVKRPIEDQLEQWKHYLENDHHFDPSLWYLAKDGNQIAGICKCTEKTVEDPDMGWVNQLCVRKPWRRRGLGMALLLKAFNDFFVRGKKRVGLGVDATSLTNATRLYERAGMNVTLQYDTYEKEIRGGEDLTTI